LRKLKKALNLHSLNRTAGLWCNGNTTVFGAVFLGSSPSRPTSKFRKPRKFFTGFLFLYNPLKENQKSDSKVENQEMLYHSIPVSTPKAVGMSQQILNTSLPSA
jgi:hypothetical protein